MTTVSPDSAGFSNVPDSFLNQPGLPFADVLSAEDIANYQAQTEGDIVQKFSLFSDGEPLFWWILRCLCGARRKRRLVGTGVKDVFGGQRGTALATSAARASWWPARRRMYSDPHEARTCFAGPWHPRWGGGAMKE